MLDLTPATYTYCILGFDIVIQYYFVCNFRVMAALLNSDMVSEPRLIPYGPGKCDSH
jgi:hypothetical protein